MSHEEVHEIMCPHCDRGQDDNGLLPYQVAADEVSGCRRSVIECTECGKHFYVKPIHQTVYNCWHGSEEFYP